MFLFNFPIKSHSLHVATPSTHSVSDTVKYTEVFVRLLQCLFIPLYKV